MSAKKDAAPVGLIPLAEAKTAAAPVVATQRSEVDPVEKWTTEGAPAWEREGAPQPSGITTTSVPRPTPDPDVEAAGEVTPEAKAEEGAPQASASAAPPAEGEAPTTPKAEVPDAAAKAAEAPAPAASPAPAPVEAPKPKTYAADEKIGLAENVEWTRGQVVEALKERVSLQERVPQLETELKTFAQTFGYPTAKEAAEAWEPALSRLRANVPLAELTDYVIMADNPEFHAYLRQAMDYYKSRDWRGCACAWKRRQERCASRPCTARDDRATAAGRSAGTRRRAPIPRARGEPASHCARAERGSKWRPASIRSLRRTPGSWANCSRQGRCSTTWTRPRAFPRNSAAASSTRLPRRLRFTMPFSLRVSNVNRNPRPLRRLLRRSSERKGERLPPRPVNSPSSPPKAATSIRSPMIGSLLNPKSLKGR